MMKTPFKKASCRVEFDYFLKGSVLKGTVDSGCSAVRTHFAVESDEPEEKVLALVRNAKQGCFAERMVTAAVPLTSTIELNGKSLSLEGVTD
jgi:uncharacterized OsmC-like protein